jgi:peptidoglycan-associated lipoprotein
LRFLAAWTAAAALAATGCQSTPKSDDDTRTGDTGSEFQEGDELSDDVNEVRLETSLQTIYFDYDRAEIRSDAVPMLRANAEQIKSNTGWGRVTIEGNCDERGSEEYNLALGERRASSVRQYLVDLGVPASRLDIVSFGESKPAVMGHDESAWKWNRRADFATVR